MDGPTAADKAFLARQLVQTTLPHTDPGEVPVWSRSNGNVTLLVQQGYKANGEGVGHPYGTIPRLLMYWMTTEAVRTKTSRLVLGDSLASFMEQLGMSGEVVEYMPITRRTVFWWNTQDPAQKALWESYIELVALSTADRPMNLGAPSTTERPCRPRAGHARVEAMGRGAGPPSRMPPSRFGGGVPPVRPRATMPRRRASCATPAGRAP